MFAHEGHAAVLAALKQWTAGSRRGLCAHTRVTGRYRRRSGRRGANFKGTGRGTDDMERDVATVFVMKIRVRTGHYSS